MRAWLERRARVEEGVFREECEVNVKNVGVLDTMLFTVWQIPVRVAVLLHFHLDWWYRFRYMRQPLGPDQKIYVTRSKLGMSHERWTDISREERAELILKKFWVDANRGGRCAYLDQPPGGLSERVSKRAWQAVSLPGK